MKLAILSDLHANLHAVQAVWQDLEAQQPDAVYCLGDLVGYGAHPNEVVEFIRSREIPTVQGNYDEGVGFDLDDCGCVYKDPDEERMGSRSLVWSRAQTRPENKAILRSLPAQIRLRASGADVLLVHGSPRKINEYLFEDRPQATFERIARAANCGTLFFGHTHLPYRKVVNDTLFVNVGSVGKPKDGDPRAGYVLAEFGPRTRVTFRRVSYNVDAAARAVRESGLPRQYADLLESGGLKKAPETPA